MLINPDRVHLTEKDIEDYLWENPREIVTFLGPVEKWIARQVQLPSGIADLVGICGHILVVVEVKNVDLTSDALTQVSRYAKDLGDMKSTWYGDRFEESKGDDEFEHFFVDKVVVFRGTPSGKLQFEADALGVSLHSFQVEMSLNISGVWQWSKDQREQHGEEIEALAQSGLFDEVRDRSIKLYHEIKHLHQIEDQEAPKTDDDSSENGAA